METNGLNRRTVLAGGGALAARLAAPAAVSAGGILLPTAANAMQFSYANRTSDRAFSATLEGMTTHFRSWTMKDGSRLAMANKANDRRLIHAVLRHKINGVLHISKYAGGSFDSSYGTVTLPSTHAHRVLSSHYGRDLNGNGAIDLRPAAPNYPSNRIDLMDFDSRGSWGVEFLFFKRYRNSSNQIVVEGMVKDINSNLTNSWWYIRLGGAKVAEFMTLFNTANNAHTAHKSAHNTAIATTTVATGLFMLAGGILLTSVACPPCGLAAAASAVWPAIIGGVALGAAGGIASGLSWKSATESGLKFHDAMVAVDAFCASNSIRLITLAA